MSRKSRGKVVAEVRPQWQLGGAVNRMEILAGVVLLLVAAAALSCEPGFNRPLRHLPVLLAGLSGIYSAWFLFRVQVPFRGALTCLALGCWWLLSVFSCAQSVDGFRSAQAISSWTAGAGLFLLAAFGLNSGRGWRATVVGLTGCAGAACVAALLAKAPNQPLMGYFTNRDTFSVIPMIGVFLTLSLAQSPGIFRPLALGGSLAFGMITLLSNSRAGALGMAIGVAGWLGALALNRTTREFQRAVRMATSGAAVLLVMGALTGIIQPLLSRFGEATDGQDIQGVTMRVDVINHGLQASRLHPFLGTGPGTFALAYQQFRPRGVVPDYIFVNYAHDDYMELLLEIGYPGFFCWLLFTTLVVLRGIRLIRFSLAPWECSCLIGCLVALGTFSALNFIFPVPAVLFWQMLVLGLLQGLPAGPAPTRPSSVLQKVAALLVAAACLGATLCSLRSLRSGLLVRKAEGLAQALRYEDAVKVLDQAVSIQPSNLFAQLERGRLLTTAGSFQGKTNLVGQGEASLENAYRISPKDQDVARVRSSYYRFAKKFGKAEEILTEAHSNAGYMEWHLPTLARLQLLQGKVESAARTIYADSLDNPDSRKLLPRFLLELESHRASAGTALLTEWSGREGEAGTMLVSARETAQLAIEENLLGVAQRLLGFLLEREPKDTRSLYLMSQVYAKQGEKRKQSNTLLKLKEMATLTTEDRYVDAALVDLARMSALTLANPQFRLLEARLQKFQASVPLRLLVSQVYLDNGKLDEASDLLAAGLDGAPENADLLAKMGTCLVYQKLYDLAKTYYEQALKQNPRQSEAISGLRKLAGQK